MVKAAGSSKDAIEKAMRDVAFVGDKNDELLEIKSMSLKAFLALSKKNEKFSAFGGVPSGPACSPVGILPLWLGAFGEHAC